MREKLTPTWKITTYRIELPEEYTSFRQSIGFDPGTTHLGVADIPGGKDYGYLYQISMERHPNPVERIQNIKNMIIGKPILINQLGR
jgi:hypothetical protein